MPSRRSYQIPVIFGLFLCITWLAALMLYRAESETKLIREAQNVLKANGLETVDVLFNGSRGLLSGQVGSPSVRNQALELVSGLDGVRSVSVDGIRVEPTLPTATAMNLPDIGASRSLQ